MRKILLLILTALLASHGQLLGQCANNDNRCLDFDPTSPSDYVQTTSSPVAGNSNFTVEARFLCTSTGTSTRRLFAFAGGTNNRFEISESGGALRFTRQVVGGSVTTSGITSPNVRDNAWHHLAATRNGTTVRVYLDGTQVYSTTGFVGDLNTTTFRIGASVLSVGATFHWDGRIDEVRVWDVERTAQQINQFRLCWVPCTSTGLKAYYQFNHGVGGGNNTGITVLEDCNDQINGILNDFTLMGSNSNWVCSNDSAFTNGICCTAAFNVSQQTCGEVDFLNTTNGNFTYSWNFGDGSTSDQTSPTHVYTSSGTYTVTLTATPVPTGAPCSVQQTITVVADNVPPTVNCRSATINYSGGLVAIIPNVVHLSSSDNCCASNNITLSLSGQTIFDCSDVCQTRTVTLVATDCVGNTATCTATITVNDAEPPVAICKNVNVGIGSPGTFTIMPNDVNDGSTDNCLPLNLSVSPNMFTCPTQGCEQVHIVTLQATDCAGNASTCTAQVTVRDVIGPVFANCPSSGNLIVIDLPPNECVTPNFFTVPATDNCDMTLDVSFEMTGATNISGPGNGEGEPMFAGFTTITYLANDDCGNTSTCVFDVLVRDNQPPFIVCPPNLTVQGSTANGGATVNLPSPIATDNCIFTTVTSSHASGSLFPCGNTVVIYTATDQNGNSAICTTTVTVDCSAGPACECGTFSGLTLGPKGGKVIQLACGQNSNVPCPVAGASLEIKGSFTCNPTTCAPSNMTWTIKNSDGLTVASGTMAASPFTLAVSGSAMSAPDTYTLTLGADCGQTGCTRCVIGLVVEDCCANRALDFDGGDDQVSLAPCPVSGNSDFTAEVIFTCTATSGGGTGCGGNFRRLITLSGPGSRFELGECGGILNVYWYDGTAEFGPTPMEPNLNVRDGVCRHIAAVRSGDNVEVFLNGTSIYTGSGVNPLNTNLFRLGQWGGSTSGENWQGTMDEVRLWNYPRTAAQINEFRNCPLTGNEAGLMVYWPMDQGLTEGNNPTVTQALDATTGLDNGILNNFALSGAHSNWVCGCSDFGEGCSRVDTLCGKAVVTCFPGWINGQYQNGVDLTSPAFGIVDIRDRSSAPTGAIWTAASGANIHHPPHWTAANVGMVFGIAIDKSHNFYLSSTTLYGCPSPSFNPFGPAGAAGIYQVNPSDAITPFITTGAFNTGGTGTTIPNSGSGLGNICYDPDHDQLFATNFSDGMIYRIKGGLVVDRFDPFTLVNSPSSGTGSDPDFVTLDERTWGIAYNKVDKRVYFSRWREDRGRPNTSIFNEIWSVGLDGSGGFTGTCAAGTCSGSDVKELDVPDHVDTYGGISQRYSNPVSDIAFSDKGLMLIAERSMRADCGDATKTLSNWHTWYSHQGRVLEFEKTGGGWGLTPGHAVPPFVNYASELKFKVGGPYSPYPNFFANSAGGVDYGYDSFKDAPTLCDNTAWMTADFMNVTGGPVYGLQGNLASGGGTSNGYEIDYDGVPGTKDKVLQGDVEIFKCISCAEVPPCDSLSVSLTPVPFIPGQTKDCCYNINLSNAVPATFASVNISVSGASLNVLDVHPNTGAGWGFESFVDGISAELEHSGGYIPTGTFSCGSICLSNISAVEQSITLQFLDALGASLCDTVIKVQCDFCAAVTQDTITCLDGGLQQLTFCIEAADNLGYSIQSVVLTPQQSGVTFTPKAFTIFPPLAPGDPCRTITTTVDVGSSGVAGELCYTVTVHEADITKGMPPLRCCMIDHCTTLPDCLCDSTLTYATFERATPLAEGLCCYNIVLHQPVGAFVTVETEVVSTGSTLSGVGSDPDWDGTFITPKDVWWTPDPSSTLPAVTTLPTLCFGGEAPQVLEITWMTADSLICQDYLQFNCTDYDCAVFDSVSMTCNVFGGSTVTFQFAVTNLSGLDANQVALVNMSPAGVITGQTIFSVNLPDGATSPILTTMLNNSVGTEACFQVNLYYQNPDDSLDIKDCCLTDTLCFIMPRCTLPNAIQPIMTFPNPTRDEVIVYFSEGSPANGYLRVLDLTGRILREESVPTGQNTHKTSLRDYPPGLYFIEVTEGQQRIWSGKVVRQGWD